jgi:hypothetical protein
VNLIPDDCRDFQDALIVGKVITRSGAAITKVVGGTCDPIGNNPEITFLSCRAMLGPAGSATVDVFFRAKKKDGAQNTGIVVELTVECGNKRMTAAGNVNLRCP